MTTELSTSRARTQRSTAAPDLEAIPQYLREITRGALLTAEEEVALARALRGPDAAAAERARRRLIESNLRLVITVARTGAWAA